MSKRATVVVALAFVAVASRIGAQRFLGGVVVTVHNVSGAEITALRVGIGGRHSERARLSPKETWRASLEVEGDSSVSLSWTDAEAGSVSKSLDVYLMKGHAGRLEVRVEPAAVLRWKGHLRGRLELLGNSVAGVVW
jgi:hypothetical protein